MVDEIMCLDLPVEEREQVMRDNCDQILERSYTNKFDQDAINARRAEYANVGIQVAELEKQLAEIRAEYKGKIKPLVERMSGILEEIKSGGEWVTTDVFLFKDFESGMAAIYAPDGHLLEKRPLTPGEKQPTIMSAIRNFRTGTDD
ncbi:hypothetical protein C5O23_08995 [Duncaniella muris]|uniref:Uncharacterized protein n=2 Tax=Duncaniella muris TaxID=2094150 RepID=A0A2V1IM08_9BACT|nr:hypothetical protein C5O23_08995 [Duncaniella muris]